MTFIIIENLRGYFIGRPPIVMFMVCLASFAIVLLSFAYVVRTKELPNPDVTDDWNSFLTKFSNLEFCVDSSTSGMATVNVNSTGRSLAAVVTKRPKVHDKHPADVLEDIQRHLSGSSKEDKETSEKVKTTAPESLHRLSKRSLVLGRYKKDKVTGPSQMPQTTSTVNMKLSPYSDNIINVTVPLFMSVAPSAELLALPLNSMHLTGQVSKSLLKLNGQGKTMHISLSFPSNLTEANCVEWERKRCSLYRVNTCVTFSGLASMFPRTRRPDVSAVCEGGVTIPTPDSNMRNISATSFTVSSSWCAGGTKLTAEFSVDEALTVLLSQEDRSMINMHLMRTSYFLFVMVITLLCYAMVRGRTSKVKAVHVSYEKMSSSGL